jgi:uncharacterized protein
MATNDQSSWAFSRCFRCGNVWQPRRRVVHICPSCKSPHWNVPRPAEVPPFDPENWAWRTIVVPNRTRILSAAKKHHARNVRVFGSVREGRARPASDLDLLVSFDARTSLLDQVGLQQDLEELLGRKVDVVSDRAVHWLLKPQIMAEAIPL